MYDLQDFGLTDLIRLSADIRAIRASSLEEVAGRVVAHLRSALLDKDSGLPAPVLARIYKTHSLSDLPPSVAAAARASGDDLSGDTRCLTLLASTGDKEAWNDRRKSVGHQAIPLPSADAINGLPMVRALIHQLGVEIDDVIDPPEILVDRFAQDFNVFYVEKAEGSPFVPAQDFVRDHGVRSVLGFGGVLPRGDLWAAILFTRCTIGRDVAELFRSVALSVSVAMLQGWGKTFADHPAEVDGDGDVHRWRSETLQRLLEVRERAVVAQTEQLHRTLIELDLQTEELRRSQLQSAQNEARKAAIIDSSLDAIVTMTVDGMVDEFNPAAEEIFGYKAADVIGRPMSEVIIPERLRQAHWDGLENYLRTGVGPILGQRIQVPGVRADGEEIQLELTVTEVALPESDRLFSAHIRDITEQLRAEQELRDFAHTLQSALLPPTDPKIPGLEIVTEFRTPHGSAGEIGGDFYDPFPVGQNRWAISMGDVCGKGAKAAALTTFVRHSLRVAEHHHVSPEETLREVNRLVLESADADDDAHFCTAALARFDLADGCVRGRLSLAGHPPPAIVSSSGEVRLLGSPALPLGLFEDFEAQALEFDLRPGDSMVLYTDGVTEARDADGSLFGEKKLAAALAEGAGRSAREQLEELMTAVALHSPEPTDDIAVVLIRVPSA